jgi:hypothetical protein
VWFRGDYAYIDVDEDGDVCLCVCCSTPAGTDDRGFALHLASRSGDGDSLLPAGQTPNGPGLRRRPSYLNDLTAPVDRTRRTNGELHYPKMSETDAISREPPRHSTDTVTPVWWAPIGLSRTLFHVEPKPTAMRANLRPILPTPRRRAFLDRVRVAKSKLAPDDPRHDDASLHASSDRWIE